MRLLKSRMRIVAAATAAGVMAIAIAARADLLRDAAAVQNQLNASIRANAAASRTAKGKLSASEAATVRRMAANFSRTGDEGALLRDWRRLIAAMGPGPLTPTPSFKSCCVLPTWKRRTSWPTTPRK